MARIHPTALVSDLSRLEDGVEIGPYSIVHDHVVIGRNSKIGSHCELGHATPLAKDRTLVIGPDSLIRSHSIFYQGSTFGPELMTGHHVIVRENTVAGKNLHIGTFGDFQGDCRIGDYVRAHSNVFIGKDAKIGNFVWIFPHVVFTNDPHPPSNVLIGPVVEDYAAISARSVILPGIVIGMHSLVAAGSVVNRDVKPRTVVGGVPAKLLCDVGDVRLRDAPEQPAYPWPRQFRRGYPEDVIREWDDEFSR